MTLVTIGTLPVLVFTSKSDQGVQVLDVPAQVTVQESALTTLAVPAPDSLSLRVMSVAVSIHVPSDAQQILIESSSVSAAIASSSVSVPI